MKLKDFKNKLIGQKNQVVEEPESTPVSEPVEAPVEPLNKPADKWRICDTCGKDFELFPDQIFATNVRVIRGGFFAVGLGVTCPHCKTVNYY